MEIFMNHVLRKIFFLGMCFLPMVLGLGFVVSAEVSGQVGRSENATLTGKRVFYASHSLMWYVGEPLEEFAQARGVKDHQLMGIQKIGASQTSQHWELPDPNNEAKKALRSGKVDVFVMSPITFPDPAIESFVKLGLEHRPDMEFLVQISWGGADQDNQDFPKGVWEKVSRELDPKTLSQLFQRNMEAGEAQVKALNEKYGKGKTLVRIVPAAQASIALRQKIAVKEMPGLVSQESLFVDSVHPSAPLEALISYLHFAVLYGVSPEGNVSMRMMQPSSSKWDERLDRELQRLAWKVAKTYESSGLKAGKL